MPRNNHFLSHFSRPIQNDTRPKKLWEGRENKNVCKRQMKKLANHLRVRYGTHNSLMNIGDDILMVDSLCSS